MPDHPALTRGLLTLIGNKRSLLPFLYEGLRHAEEWSGTAFATMADAFAGSGVVTRLARLAGVQVHSNDLEQFAGPGLVTAAVLTPARARELSAWAGGYEVLLDRLNELPPPRPDDEWCARHYAPRSTRNADPGTERLFYTRENALRIDAILGALHGGMPELAHPELRALVLAPLLVEMSVHSNTSGVMKGFHWGWGGRGGDALTRILAPIQLEPMPLIDGPVGSVSTGDAAMVCADGREFDVVYADPPYTSHQYGSNYHLLTSAVVGDHYDPGPVARGSRAGIRRDHTRSDYCRRQGNAAHHAFEEFLASVRCRALLVSYNADGIIAPGEMAQMLSGDGEHGVQLLSTSHPRFRGGKSTNAGVRTTEYLFVVVRGRGQSRSARRTLDDQIAELTLRRSLTDRFIIPERWRAAGGTVERTGSEWRLQSDAEVVEPDGSQWLFGAQDVEPPKVTAARLTCDLRVANLDTAVLRASGVQRRLVASTGTVSEAVDALIDEGAVDEAVDLLSRLKIRRYREDFARCAKRLSVLTLSAQTRHRLDQLCERVLGSACSEGDRTRESGQ